MAPERLADLFKRFKSSASRAAVDAAAGRVGAPRSAVRNLESFLKLSGNAASGFPTEMLGLGMEMWSGFILTPFAEQQMAGWVFPYWLDRQRTPSSASFIPHGHFWLECNMTHRNWTGIGLCGHPDEALVDPRGLITPWPFAPSVDVWLMAGGELAGPSTSEDVRQSLDGPFPIVRTRFAGQGLECTMTAFVAPLDTVPVALSVCEVTNVECEAQTPSLVISVRPYNTETVCAINDLEYDPAVRIFTADENELLYLGRTPSEVLLSDYEHGDVALLLKDARRERLPAGTLEVKEPFGLATGAAVFRLEAPVGGTETVVFACPLSAGTHPGLSRLLPEDRAVQTAAEALSGRREYWRALSSEGMRISLPDAVCQETFEVNRSYLLLLFDGRSITPGVSTYHMMWFRDAAYLLSALERIGHADKVRDVLSTYPDRQTADGFFRSHQGEWDSNGQAMCALVNHYRMTGDREFAMEVYPSLMKGARWIDARLRRDLPEGNPGRGLMPPGISAEHFGTGAVYYWDDLWSVGGLRAAAGVAADLGFSEDSRYLERVASEIWDALEASWAIAGKRLGRAVMPVGPGRDLDSAAIGNVAAVYPLDLMDAGRPLIADTLREIREKCFYGDVFFHAIMHCGLNAYLSLQIAQYCLRLRDPYALTIFNALLSMATPTFTFPEAINPLTGGGAYGDGHHGWAVSEFLSFIRNMLLVEEGRTLALLAVSKPEWLEAGRRIVVERAPSFFGEVSYRVEASPGAVVFDLPGSFERPPDAVELNLPFPITSCEADGRAIPLAQGARRVAVPPETARAVLSF